MTQEQVLRRIKRGLWRTVERTLKSAYQEGFRAGLARAHGQGRRGRTIRGDATVEGLVNLVNQHFGLDRYGFEVRVVHADSGRRVPAADQLRKYIRED